jgi:hypothetical protein
MKYSLPWCLNIGGLFFGALAAGLMYYFPPRLQVYTETGESVVTWTGAQTEKGKRLGKRQAVLAKAGPVLLGFAFFLQFVAAWVSP